jgi:putative addiction module component (TIGR02574 family)
MSAQSIAESFRTLDREEKIRLLLELWDEVAEESSELPLEESHRKLLDARLREHEQNPDDVEGWEKVRDDVLAEL